MADDQKHEAGLEALKADVDQAIEMSPDLWAEIEADLDSPGPRDALVSLSTPVRRLLAVLGLFVIGAAIVALQGVRGDLDQGGWLLFAACSSTLIAGSLVAAAFSLRNRADAPMPAWPWVPVAWAWTLGVAAIAPWPGMTGVPPEMILHCFAYTSAMVVFATLWFALLERATTPVPWRIGLAAAAAGMGAFAFQSVFCPGVDVLHLVVGHGGASVAGASVAVLLAMGLQFLRR